jgi:MoaA/NifB/PqqE/SkfB family radical SAM enzyme
MRTGRHDAPHWRNEVQRVDDMYASGRFAMPVHYVLSLTHECNLLCPFCFLEKIPGDRAMGTDDWLAVLDQLPPYARVILFGGEPLLFPGFADVFRSAASRYRCSIVTNGTLLTPDTVEMLVAHDGFCDLTVSVDSLGNWNRNLDAATWQRLVDGVTLYNTLRRRRPQPPRLGISVVLLDETAEELHDLHRFAHEELQCDFVNYCLLNGAPMQLADVMRPFAAVHAAATPPHYAKWDLILAQLERNRQYDRAHGHVAYLRPKLIDLNESAPTAALRSLNDPGFVTERFGPCKQPWSDCRIHPDGHVSACLSVSFGNVKQTGDLAAILDGPIARRFREELRADGPYAQCERCVFLYDRAFDRTAAPAVAEPAP